jgi:hypothetical protein
MKAKVMTTKTLSKERRRFWNQKIEELFLQENLKLKPNSKLKNKLNKELYGENPKRAFMSRISEMEYRPHLLQVFGVSDRQTIDASDLSPNVPQALAMINSRFIADKIVSKKYAFYQTYQNKADINAKIDACYLMFFCRYPDDMERQDCLEMIKSGKVKDLKEMIWMFVNTHEFKFLF